MKRPISDYMLIGLFLLVQDTACTVHRLFRSLPFSHYLQTNNCYNVASYSDIKTNKNGISLHCTQKGIIIRMEKEFRDRILNLALPIAAQQFILALVSACDVIVDLI